jgi:hypothetical protein
MNFCKDQLVATTQSLDGDCGLFSVKPGTIAKVVKHDKSVHMVRIVVTPHNKGFVTTDDLNIRALTCCEIALYLEKFLIMPKDEFKPLIVE